MVEQLKFPQSFMVIRQSSYSLKAVSNGHTSLGIVASDGVVIGTTTRKTSELMEARHGARGPNVNFHTKN
ncbi:GL14472 [Drosophila persimilis]|uniref:GL14472 n=1 Tax=Drosophila persimilis TaxID=7234 RepID=B4IR47_DROPE|nr:GL14472 [Drosophila persimilis]